MVNGWFFYLHGKILANLFLSLLCGMSAMAWEDWGCLDILCMTDVHVYVTREVPHEQIVNVLIRICHNENQLIIQSSMMYKKEQ